MTRLSTQLTPFQLCHIATKIYNNQSLNKIESDFNQEYGEIKIYDLDNNHKLVVDSIGIKRWFLEIGGVDKLHREDGPAVEYYDGSTEYWINGKLHREDGPAIERVINGSKEWYKNGKKHREDGPAVEYPDSKEWYLNGERHREDGPAVISRFGPEEWYLNGKLHREDGPAVVNHNGEKYWYLNGKRHREDGPAIEGPDEYKYYINNNFININDPSNQKRYPDLYADYIVRKTMEE